MNFSEYTKQPQQEKKKEERTKPMSEEDVMKQYEELKGMDNSQLKARLIDEVAKQKRDGTFDYASLAQSVESIKGYLPQKTYQNLKNMLDNLR